MALLHFDHIFRIVDKKIIADARKLLNVFSASEFRQNGSSIDSWEGLYFYSAQDSGYFEVLQESTHWHTYETGVGLSHLFENAGILERLKAMYSNEKWKNERQFRADGGPWFDFCEILAKDRRFCPWVMEYQGDELAHRQNISPKPRSNISSFIGLDCYLAAETFAQVAKDFEWIGTKKNYEDRVDFLIPKQNGATFNLCCQKSPIDRADFHLHLELVDDHPLASVSTQYVGLVQTGRRVTVSFFE